MFLFQQVEKKDINNYPAEAFPNKNPFTRVELTEEQKQIGLSFIHPRRCLRLIRDFHALVLREANPSGISKKDYNPYLIDYIWAHFKKGVVVGKAQAEADKAYIKLQKQLIKDCDAEKLPSDLLTWKNSLVEYLEYKHKKKLQDKGKNTWSNKATVEI